jgi:hypothetical protein
MAHPSQTAPKTVTSRGRVTVMAVHGFSVAMVHSTTRPAGRGPQEGSQSGRRSRQRRPWSTPSTNRRRSRSPDRFLWSACLRPLFLDARPAARALDAAGAVARSPDRPDDPSESLERIAQLRRRADHDSSPHDFVRGSRHGPRPPPANSPSELRLVGHVITWTNPPTTPMALGVSHFSGFRWSRRWRGDAASGTVRAQRAACGPPWRHQDDPARALRR